MQLNSGKRDVPLSASVDNSMRLKKRAVLSGSQALKAKLVGQMPLSSQSKNAASALNDTRILLHYPNLVPARLIRRYKRFLADVVLLDKTSKIELTDQEEVTVYCPNTGPMVGLLDGLPNTRVQLSKSDDPKRKYAYTLEMIQIHNGDKLVWVGVHSALANRMVEQALTLRWLTELGDYDTVRREVKFAKNSRVDFVLTAKADDGTVLHEKYVEVKSVTLALESSCSSVSRCAVFPDTVSSRAQKHVKELTELVSTKARNYAKSNENVSVAIVFIVQREDCHMFTPSIHYDKQFASLCSLAANSGIQLLCYSCGLTIDESSASGTVKLLGPLPFQH
ncbi:hypothetical protein CCR75_002174 [Bremia lactucae]|uniref:Sugar fermentation stimulation protein homolog n=1 Tax=Bremia lactucae TaxID=4779 RepID=A0A976IGH6_BRELC|nr:hypothetical protein CCR75_002174 [Bremia lactucae]